MFRSGDKPKTLTSVNVLLADGGVGDHVCALVATKHLIENFPWINPLIWVPDYLLEFAKNVLPSGSVVRNYSDAKTKYNAKLPGVSTKWTDSHTPQRTHPVDYAFHNMIDLHLDDYAKKNYPRFNSSEVKIPALPEKYAVVCPLSVERVKRFHPVVVNQVSDYLVSKGITPVYLGKEEFPSGAGPSVTAKITPANYEKGINLINKTSLVESAAIIAGAKVLIGMDGGLIHVAGCTDTPIIVGYTFINPNHNMPIRNDTLGYNVFPITPPESLGCRFCQTKGALHYNHDFRQCFYDDFKCVDYITFEEIKQRLESII